MSFRARSLRILGSIFVVYALLVATHRGEFWPFSIYPMFSQAGEPWSRAVVRTLPNATTPDSLGWRTVPLDRLPGDAYPLREHGINQNDLSTYLAKTEQWTDDRVDTLHSLFVKNRSLARPLLVYRVKGKLIGDSVSVRATPVLLITAEAAHLSPTQDSSR